MWGSSKGSKADIETGYYDEYGNWIEYNHEDDGYFGGNQIPDGNLHDGEGRLLDPDKLHQEFGDQEDPAIFISEFKPPRMVITLLFYNHIHNYDYNNYYSVQLLMQCLYL